MGSSVEGGRRVSMMSDEELLRTIGEDLRSLYADIIRQPLTREDRSCSDPH